MSYSLSLNSVGSLGDGSQTGTGLRRLGAGQLVTARFQPLGTTAANTNTVKAQLETRMASLGIFKTPEFVGWGRGDNNGLFVYRAELKTGQFTAQQVADTIKAAMPGLDTALGAKRLNFLTIRHPTPSGENVPAATPDTPVTPEAGGGSYGGDGGGGGGGAQEEEESFFTRKVGGVPVWAIGAGVLVLGAGLVFVATRKKTAPAALAANTKRKRRYLDSTHGKQRVARELGVTAADIASWIADPSIGERETMHMYRQARGSKSASRSLQRIRNARRSEIDLALMPRAMKRNDRRWEAEQRARNTPRWARSPLTREEQAINWYLSFVEPDMSPDDREAAQALTAERYPDVDLKRAMRKLARNPVYALPERKAYPITSRKDAYHATQRLKQGRVKDEADAKRIIAAIKRTHPDIWREYLEGYSVSKIMTSKRKGLTARRRA